MIITKQFEIVMLVFRNYHLQLDSDVNFDETEETKMTLKEPPSNFSIPCSSRQLPGIFHENDAQFSMQNTHEKEFNLVEPPSPPPRKYYHFNQIDSLLLIDHDVGIDQMSDHLKNVDPPWQQNTATEFRMQSPVSSFHCGLLDSHLPLLLSNCIAYCDLDCTHIWKLIDLANMKLCS